MDRLSVTWVLGANIVALAVLYQRLVTMGYVLPVQDQLEQLQAKLGLIHDDYQQCGLYDAPTFILTSSRVVFPDGVRPGAVTIRKGRIADVSEKLPKNSPYPVIDYKYAVISPGVIDAHVHMNEPGREHWEGISTGTAAAAAGGTTTVVEMPLNSDPVTTTAQLLTQKMEVAKAKARVHVGFWGGIVPSNAAKHHVLGDMLAAGALGFKSFVSPSGINDFPNVTREDVEAAVPFLMQQGVPYLVHSELVTPVEQQEDAEPRQYATYLATRPAVFEQDAIAMLLDVLSDQKAPPAQGFFLHIVHLGDATNVDALKVAKKRLAVSVETCPHYLLFQADSIPEGQTKYKCAPPIRDRGNRQGLLGAVADGKIDLISSDHSPAPPDMKELESGDFLKAWGGISGLQYLLPSTWTAVKGLGVDLLHLSQLLSTNPAHLAGLRSKGRLARGMDADIVVWDPEAIADTSLEGNQHKHKVTPYADMPLKGKVLATFVGGHKVFDEEQGVYQGACGSVVKGRWFQKGLMSSSSSSSSSSGSGPATDVS